MYVQREYFPDAPASEIKPDFVVAQAASCEFPLNSNLLMRGRPFAWAGGLTLRRRALQSRHYDDWTIESWRIEPRLRALEVDIDEPDQNPPLWKDLTLASVIAALLWGAAAMIFA
jgi:hypothetical protein